jgi:hypothetical protein
MDRPTRWYLLLSFWILIASCLYLAHGVSTFPLNVLALIGLSEMILNPSNQLLSKNLVITLIHTVPFLWIPYDMSRNAFNFAVAIIFLYLLFITFMRRSPVDIYQTLLLEKHVDFKDFVCERFGFCGDQLFSV